LLKWNKKASVVKADPYLLNLKRSIKDPLIDNNFIKANILAANFFSKIRAVDFSNINTEVIIK
jgi:hypothetical protein